MQRFAADVRVSFVRWSLVAAVGMLLLIFGLLVFSPIVRVREITVLRSNPRLDIESVQENLAQLFGAHLFFLPTHDVVQILKAQIPDIEEAEVRKNYPSQLTVRITLRPLVARLHIVNPDAPDAGTGAITDFVTDNGIYVSTATPGEVDTLPLVEVVDWAAFPTPGTQLLSADLMDHMRKAENALEVQFGQTISERTVYLRAREYHLKAEPYDIWFDTAGTLDDELVRYRTFLQSVPQEEVREYVDLRMSDRVIYK